MSPHSDFTHALFRKTDMGREVLQGGRQRLPLRHRQLLVLMDGTRSLDTLRHLLNGAGQDLDSMVRDLHREGLVTAADEAAGALHPRLSPTHGAAPLQPELAAGPATDPKLIVRAKAVMLETARTYLGVLAEKLGHEITAAQDDGQLRKAMAHWNMALRESIRGADMASRHLAEVRAILDGSA